MKTINKNVVMLGWVSYFTDMASAMINPILPIFVVVVLHDQKSLSLKLARDKAII